MALRNIPDPRLHDWVTWADAIILHNPRAARIMEYRVDEGEAAEGWRAVADVLALLEPTTPRHDFFDDWREWAFSLMAVNGS